MDEFVLTVALSVGLIVEDSELENETVGDPLLVNVTVALLEADDVVVSVCEVLVDGETEKVTDAVCVTLFETV